MNNFKKCDTSDCRRKIPAHMAFCCMACELYGKHNKKCNEHFDYYGNYG